MIPQVYLPYYVNTSFIVLACKNGEGVDVQYAATPKVINWVAGIPRTIAQHMANWKTDCAAYVVPRLTYGYGKFAGTAQQHR